MYEEQKLNRRAFMQRTAGKVTGAVFAAGGLGLLSEEAACAQRYDQRTDDLDKYDFILPRVKFAVHKDVPDQWNVRPGGDANLLDELHKAVRCKIKPIRGSKNWNPNRASPGQLNAVVTLDEPRALNKYPFVFMTGESPYNLSERQRKNLKDYVTRGGFILMDDCMVDPGGDFFYQSTFKILNQIFGRGAVKRVPNKHEIFHNVYDLSRIGLPHVQAVNHGARGIFIGDRLGVFLSSTDIHCGWCDRDGEVMGKNGGKRGPHGYKEAIKMGINIVMYALSH